MIQNVLRAMGGIENYGIISVCLFFFIFLSVVVFAFLQKKPFCKTMSALPLDDGELISTTKEARNEK